MDRSDLSVPLEGFEDVTPIPQDDGVNPVVAIAYPHNYVVASDYMRAFLASGELSKRVLQITHLVLEYNPSHYTAWWLRRRVLFALDMDLENELHIVAEIAGENPKNYQTWYHRRAISERRGTAGHEMEYVNQVLEDDPKNYHAWSHRQWVLQEFKTLEKETGRRAELAGVDEFIRRDIRNNSAWNHRWFVLHSPLNSKKLSDEIIRAELSYALGYAEMAPHNESSWNYIRGFFGVHGQAYVDFPDVKDRTRKLQQEAGGATSPHLHGLLLEIYEEEGTEDSLNKAIDTLQKLRNEVDVVRAKYWERRLRAVTERLVDLVSQST